VKHILLIEPQGFAFGFAVIEGRNIPLPGRFERSADGRKWINDTTGFEIDEFNQEE
jgi:hypothetical protein